MIMLVLYMILVLGEIQWTRKTFYKSVFYQPIVLLNKLLGYKTLVYTCNFI